MKRIGFFCAICLVILLLPSCLTIEESYEFKRNGSGMMEYRIKVSEMADFLETLNKDDSELPTEKLSMADLVPHLAQVEGISHVELLDNVAESIYGLRFRFKNMTALNEALNLLLIKEPETNPHVFFSQNGNVITRNHLMTKQTIAEDFLEETENTGKTLAVLQSMNYKINFKFSRPVKVVYSIAEASLIGKKSREVKLETSMKALVEDSETLNTSIVLK